MDVNGKDPVVDPFAAWPQTPSTDAHRSGERHRVRRRSRRPNNIRAKIRVRMWLACAGALLAMVVIMYLALGRERVGESGARLSGSVRAVAALSGGPSTGAAG